MPVYLDFNATTPIGEKILDSMLPYLGSRFGNPSSLHSFGRAAKEAVNRARAQIADAVGCQSAQVIFTSGGSEANNLFVKGMAAYLSPSRIAISSIEHPSVAKPAASLTRSGWSLRRMAVDSTGGIDMQDVENALSEPTGMASVMLANNETGCIQDVARIAEMAKSKKVWMHTDAVQALGKIPIDFSSLGVHAMTISGHKIYGPKGVGALIVDKRLPLMPLIEGGGQESGLRSGTENVAAIVGFGVAVELAKSGTADFSSKCSMLKERLEADLCAMGAVLFSVGPACLPNTVYFSFPGIDGGTLVVEMDRAGFAVGSGSACSSGATEPSATLLAMGVDPDVARGAVRVSFGEGSSEGEVAEFLDALGAARLRFSAMASR